MGTLRGEKVIRFSFYRRIIYFRFIGFFFEKKDNGKTGKKVGKLVLKNLPAQFFAKFLFFYVKQKFQKVLLIYLEIFYVFKFFQGFFSEKAG